MNPRSLSAVEAPYRGIEPYRFVDRPIFFARDSETRKLLRAVTIFRGVLLYGTTGAGKSSLINAGLIPAVLDEDFVPDRIRVQPEAGKELIVERVWSPGDGEDLPVSTFLRRTAKGTPRVILSVDAFQRRLRRASSVGYPLLIFDQFEELITLFEEAPRGRDLQVSLDAQQSILQLIVDLLRDQTLPIKLLFAFREDYLAKLTKLFLLLPDLQDQYLRLTWPHYDVLHKIIRGPFERPELRAHFGKELSEELALSLIQKLRDRSEGQRVNLTEVQIVCSELWQSQSPEHLFEKRGIQGLLEDYTTNAIDKLAADHLKGAAIALLSRLVTPSGTRNIVAGEELIDRVHAEEHIEREMLEHALQALETKTKLVVREQRHGSAFYEIISEFLVPWIQQQKNERLVSRRSKGWEAERRLSESPGISPGSVQTFVADPDQYVTLQKGVAAWNEWRTSHPAIRPNLAGATLTAWTLDHANLTDSLLTNANLARASLRNANLQGADLSNANLAQADLTDANLSGANLSGALIREARLHRADLRQANLASASLQNALLTEATLERSDLSRADLTGADLRGADLSYVMMVDAKLTDANIENCRVYGIAAWNLDLTGARQLNLTITRPDEPVLTVDNLEIAQYFYMLLNSSKLRDILSATTSKVVLVLGRFTAEGKELLESVRRQLRERGYVPIVFDFEGPAHRDSTETVLSLAHMSKFILAFASGARTVPMELMAIVPQLPSVPVVVLFSVSEPQSAMFESMRRYPSVLPAFRYSTMEDLAISLKHKILPAAERKFHELSTPRRVLPS